MDDMTLLIIVLLVLVSIGFIFFFFYWKKRKFNFVNKIQLAENAFKEGNLEKAKKLYEFVIIGIESTSEKNWEAEIIEKK